jgi:hypothetical protein
MKTKFLFLSMIALFAFTSISCSKSDPDTTPAVVPPPIVGVINTGDLKLFVIDTAKVNTITMTGTNETTILNKKVNSNSYIGGLSLKSDASKFVYVDNQGSMVNGGYVGVASIRTANANGTSDANIYTAPANTTTVNTSIGFVKYGASKIYFNKTVQTISGGLVSRITNLNAMNADGTGLVALPGIGDGNDVTSDGRFLLSVQAVAGTSNKTIFIYDKTGDNGAGTLYNSETVPATASLNIAAPIFSYDDKYAYYAYAENQSLKVRIFNMTAKTWETKVIATNFTTTSFFISMSIASDNNRGIVVIDAYNNGNLPTKSYVFNLTNGTSTTFNNNDDNINFIKAF